ncbi:MAG: tetraacyldisaccharide 4'-kinase [Candidatus Omnitrophota bacterium]
MQELIKAVMTDQDNSWVGKVLKPCLWGLSLVYGLAIILRKFFYRFGIMPGHKASFPVISIGNITAGGVGKTPLVIFLAEYLLRKGKRPVILTRGYMGKGQCSSQASDEARMMSEKLSGVPVMVDPDRFRATKEAERKSLADVYLMDDGFQHWHLKRDLDLVAIDATNSFGNGSLLPCGILREPLSALARADLFILTKSDAGCCHVAQIRQILGRINPDAHVVETVHAPVALVDMLSGQRDTGMCWLKDRVVAVCAIGSPGSFADTLKNQGAVVEKLFVYEDHHVYNDEDLAEIVCFCQNKGINKVVTTHKDAVKIRGILNNISGIRFFVLEIDIKVIHGEVELFSRIDRLFHS